MLKAGDRGPAGEEEGRPVPNSRTTLVNLGDLCSAPSDEDFVREAYRRILGRECDSCGLVHGLDMLRAHTPRRVVLLELVNSDEARRTGVQFTGIPAAPAARNRVRLPFGSALRHPVRLVRDVLRHIWLSPSESLQQKLSLVLREIGVRADTMSARVDQAHWTLSEKLDTYVGDLRDRQMDLSESIDSLEQYLRWAAAPVQGSFGAIKEQLREVEAMLEAQETRSAVLEAPASRQERHQLLVEQLRALRTLVDSAEQRSVSGIEETRHSVRAPVLQAGDNVLVTEVDGLIVGIPGEEWRLAAYYVFRGLPEHGVMRRFRELIRPGTVVVDVGANIGMYTLQAARKLGGRGKVHSFEPAPRTFRLLRDNVKVNGFLESGIIELHQLAVTDKAGTADLAVFSDNCGHNTLFFEGDVQRVSVGTVSLDEALKTTPVVDVVKIDAEGAEPLILRGMSNIVNRNPQIRILLEFAPVHLRRAGVAPRDFLAEIASLSLGVHRIHDESGELLEVTADELETAFSANLELHRRAGTAGAAP